MGQFYFIKVGQFYFIKIKWKTNKCDSLYHTLQQSYFKNNSNLKSISKYEIIILASIVDDLVNLDKVELMPKVARVYYNRIMSNKRLYLKSGDVAINIYTKGNLGLPSRPLNNPGIQAIKAVLKPSNHNYLDLKDIGIK